jgi:TPR repeat protein
MAKAIEYYRNASDQGHMKALLRLGICYEAISYGSILAISRKSYILIDLKQHDFANHCKESAIKGYLGAWFNVAFDYDLGINREKSTRNPSEAIRIFRYVATNDDCSDCAISHLGLLLLRESFQNNFNDDSRAFQYLKYANAYWGYAGFLYALGIGVEQNDYLAFAIFQLESERSAWDPTWAYLVGLYYQEGIAVEKNLEKAKEYFLKAIGDDDNEEDTSDRYVCYPAKFALKRLLETTNDQEKSLKKVNCCLNCKENLALATDLAGK